MDWVICQRSTESAVVVFVGVDPALLLWLDIREGRPANSAAGLEGGAQSVDDKRTKGSQSDGALLSGAFHPSLGRRGPKDAGLRVPGDRRGTHMSDLHGLSLPGELDESVRSQAAERTAMGLGGSRAVPCRQDDGGLGGG